MLCVDCFIFCFNLISVASRFCFRSLQTQCCTTNVCSVVLLCLSSMTILAIFVMYPRNVFAFLYMAIVLLFCRCFKKLFNFVSFTGSLVRLAFCVCPKHAMCWHCWLLPNGKAHNLIAPWLAPCVQRWIMFTFLRWMHFVCFCRCFNTHTHTSVRPHRESIERLMWSATLKLLRCYCVYNGQKILKAITKPAS